MGMVHKRHVGLACRLAVARGSDTIPRGKGRGMKLRSGAPEDVGMSAERIERVRRLAAGWVADGLVSALVVLIVRRGVVVLADAYGPLAPAPDGAPPPTDAIFPLVSLSKPVKVSAALVLAVVGPLS